MYQRNGWRRRGTRGKPGTAAGKAIQVNGNEDEVSDQPAGGAMGSQTARGIRPWPPSLPAAAAAAGGGCGGRRRAAPARQPSSRPSIALSLSAQVVVALWCPEYTRMASPVLRSLRVGGGRGRRVGEGRGWGAAEAGRGRGRQGSGTTGSWYRFPPGQRQRGQGRARGTSKPRCSFRLVQGKAGAAAASAPQSCCAV